MAGARAPTVAAPPRARRLRRVAVPAAGVALVALVALVVVLRPWAGRGAAGDGAASRVLVLPYDNETGDPALEPVGRMAAEWITEGLAQTGEVQVVPNLMVVQALAGRAGARTGPSRLRELAREMESGIAVTGSYYVEGDSLEFHSSVVDVATGRSLGTVATVRGPRREPGAAMEELRSRVMGVLALRLSALLGWELPGGGRAPSYEAYRAYASGMERWIVGDFLAAGNDFALAYALDSTYVRSLLLAIGAYRNGGDRRRADSVVALVLPRRQRLSPYDRYRVDFLLAPDREAALRALRAATALVPVGTARHALIIALLRAGRPHEALRSLEALLATQPEQSTWWSFYAVWALRLELLHVMGEHRRELELSAQAIARFPQSLPVMQARGAALAATGHVDEVRQLADAVVVTPPRPGISPGDVLLSLAAELRAHGAGDAAVETARRGLAWLDAQGAMARSDPQQRLLRLRLLCAAERWDSAAALVAQLRGDPTARVMYLGYGAVLAARRGAADSAGADLARLSTVLQTSDPAELALWRAYVAAQLGRRDEAVDQLRAALRQGLTFGSALHADQFLAPLRGYPPFEAPMHPED